MINTFEAVGYHGTDAKFSNDISKKIDYSLNKGDKFLGQGLYLWRDSYDRALRWVKKVKEFDNISIFAFKIKCDKDKMLNFTSTYWNKEEELLDFWGNNFSNLSFGEFLDYLIIKDYISINLIAIIDLGKRQRIINVKDKKHETNFGFGDIQLCLKNDIPIKFMEILNDPK